MCQHFLNALERSRSGFAIGTTPGTATLAVVFLGLFRVGLGNGWCRRARARAAGPGIRFRPPIRSRRFVMIRIAARHCCELLQTGQHQDVSARDGAIGHFVRPPILSGQGRCFQSRIGARAMVQASGASEARLKYLEESFTWPSERGCAGQPARG